MIDETEINGAKVFTMQLVIDGRHIYKVRRMYILRQTYN